MVSSEHKIDFQRIKRIGFGEAIFCESCVPYHEKCPTCGKEDFQAKNITKML